MTGALGEGWRAAPADEPLRRAFAAPAFDDGGWEPLVVPGHWQSTPAFRHLGGPLLYRKRFETPPAVAEQRTWLTLDGVFYDGDVWLDGGYVGATEGYFFPHSFEITDAVAAAADHVLAVEVGCAHPSDRNLTGAFQHGDYRDDEWNPGGIWQPVHLSVSGPVRITHVRVLCDEATAERSSLTVRAELNSAVATTAVLRVTVTSSDGTMVGELSTHHNLAHGDNRIRERVTVEQPELWWPHALGGQALHDVTIEVLADGVDGNVPSDVRRVRTGLREIRMNRSILTVNGERMFVKGSNQGPTRMALADATPAELQQDVVLARQAGLDLLRLHGHVGRPETYDAADRHGLLLWQDLPLQGAYARSVRKQAVRQAREAVDLLSHHPSVAVWCAHDEPGKRDAPATSARRSAVRETLPNWNKTVLDSSVSRALQRADPTRPVVAHSGIFPGDSHLYCGWEYGTERDFARILATIPRLARFVTEFGAQAVPASADFMEPDRWPVLDWAGLETHHALDLATLSNHVPPTAFATFDAWRAATQAYQATLIRFHIETLRRLKYRPAGGFCQFSFADGHPGVTWSVLDHLRQPKTGYDALVAACAPVVVVADRPADAYSPGEELVLDVHVINDLRRPLAGVRVVARLGAWHTGWEGDIPADDCVRVGTVRTPAPFAPGPFELELSLQADGLTAGNSYPARVVAAP